MEMSMKKSDMVEKCIDDCLDCYCVCAKNYCSMPQNGGEHAEAKHITLMDACAKACNMSADYMLRDVEFQKQMCGMYAQICDRCAESCDKFDDDFMKKCAETCRRCAESCRKTCHNKIISSILIFSI